MDTDVRIGYSEAQLRVQLATVTRILHSEGVLDYSGHISARVPGRDALLVQQRTDPRSDVMPDAIVMVDFDGNVIEGAPGKPPSETAIHIEILKARPDVHTVIHSHLEMAILFSMMKDTPIQPIRVKATRWKSGVPVHPDPSHIKSPEQGQRLAKTLGPHHAALIRGHGMVLVAESVPALLIDCIHFNENARAYLSILNSGREAEPLTDADVYAIEGRELRGHHVGKLWKYYLQNARKNGLVPSDWKDAAA
jgi:L-ribulose-5-phosphate 4-epimerase